jgi:prepilin-type N-terminal cleavage/methylation domain-containing protein
MNAAPRQIPSSVRIGRGGFTLIELLLALVIGTMILGATASVFVTTLDAWHRGGRASAEQQAADKIGALIERHLRAALSPAVDNQAVFRGEDLTLDLDQPGHRLTLRSTAPGRFPRELPLTDVAEVAFELDPAGDDGMTMRIQCPPDALPNEGGYLIHLSPLVRGFRVIYYDGKDWLESWSENDLPKAVEFTLLLNRADDEGRPVAGGAQPALEVKRLVWLPMGGAGTKEAEGAAMTGEQQPGAGEQQPGTGGQPAGAGEQPAAGGKEAAR